jgi:kynurenine formamidase
MAFEYIPKRKFKYCHNRLVKLMTMDYVASTANFKASNFEVHKGMLLRKLSKLERPKLPVQGDKFLKIMI